MKIMKNCTKCGSPQDDNALFCNKCGAALTNAVIPPQPQFQQPQPQFQQLQQQFQQAPQFGAAPQMQGGYGQFPAGAPVQQAQGKSKKKLIIIICAVAAVIAITLLVLFLFVFKSNKELIVGTWQEIKSDGSGKYTRFYKNGTVDLVVGRDTKASYSVDGNKLVISNYGKSMTYTITELTKDNMTFTYTTGSTTREVRFKKVDNNRANKTASKASLEEANSNAKLVYTTLNTVAAAKIADGSRVNALKTGPVSVESLKGSSDPLKAAVYEALSDNGSEKGYVYIDYDPNTDYYSNSNFVQWSDSKDGGVIGQYPDPIKTQEESDSAVLGEKYNS